jgi:hypothetical protein
VTPLTIIAKFLKLQSWKELELCRCGRARDMIATESVFKEILVCTEHVLQNCQYMRTILHLGASLQRVNEEFLEWDETK